MQHVIKNVMTKAGLGLKAAAATFACVYFLFKKPIFII